MAESANMASALQNNAFKDSHPCNVLPATLDTFKMDEIGVHHTVSINRVPLANYNAEGKYGTDKDSNRRNASIRREKDETDKNNARIIGGLPVQHIVNNVDVGRRIEYIARW